MFINLCNFVCNRTEGGQKAWLDDNSSRLNLSFGVVKLVDEWIEFLFVMGRSMG